MNHVNRTAISRLPKVPLTAVLLLSLAGPLAADPASPPLAADPLPAVEACGSADLPATSPRADPCCRITAIDVRAGLVTASNTDTGASFQFRVADRQLLRSLRVGQAVYVDAEGNRVGLTPRRWCCEIVTAQAAGPRREAGRLIGDTEPEADRYTGPPDTPEHDAAKRTCEERGNEWRCTGDIGSGNISCHCIHKGPTKGHGDSDPTVQTSYVQSELGSFAERFQALQAPLESSDRRTAERARVEYEALMGELAAWAEKNGLRGYRREVADGEGEHADFRRVPKPEGGCPTIIETADEQCVRTHDHGTWCEYFCVDIPKTEGAVKP